MPPQNLNLTSMTSEKVHLLKPTRPFSLRISKLRLTALALLLITAFSLLSTQHSPLPSPSLSEPHTLALEPITWDPRIQQSDIRIAKATILYQDATNDLFERALKLHEVHDQRFGYEMHVLRKEVVRGGMGKILLVLEVVMGELSKSKVTRAEWILYFDPTVLLQNDAIPLHMFLPPATDFETFKTLSFIATKDNKQILSTAVFFVRVSPGSVKLLIQAMAHALNQSDVHDGRDIWASALQFVLNQDGNREKVVYQDPKWYNSSTANAAAVFTQVPSTGDGRKLLAMEEMVEGLEKGVPYTGLFPKAEDAQRFWSVVREARRVLYEAKERVKAPEHAGWKARIAGLEYLVEERTWDVEEILRSVETLKAGLGI